MATFKSIEVLGTTDGDSFDEEFALSISGAASGDTVLLVMSGPGPEALEYAEWAMPSGWVNAIDAEDPYARFEDATAGLWLYPYVYDGVPPEANIELSFAEFTEIVAVVLTLAAGEALSSAGFAAHYDASVAEDEDVEVPFDAPATGTLALIGIRRIGGGA